MPSSTSTSLARFASLVVLLQLFVTVLGHIEVVYPPPINSKYDLQTLEADKDYSMTSPLFPDGSNFPCKGYNTPSNYAKLNSVATLTAGSTMTLELAGTATHNGGSCQISISYDQGSTWAVIHSIIGGCPIGLKFDVPIPANLPSAKKATFAWTWFNYSGNREMYMDCSIVDIVGSSATSYTGPSLYRVNTFADDTCITTENQNIVFPNPGSSVQYGDSMSSSSPAIAVDNCYYDQDSDVTIRPSGGSNAETTTTTTTSTVAAPSSTTVRSPVQETTTTTQAAAPVTTSRSAAPTTTQTPSQSTTTTSRAAIGTPRSRSYLNNPRFRPSATSKAPASSSARSAAGFATSADLAASLGVAPSPLPSATTTSPPTPSVPTPASATASTSTSASGDATVRCDTTTTWSLCGNGVCTFMGEVPTGTVCRNGGMVMERRRQVKKVEAGSHLRMAMVRRAKAVAH